MKPIRGVCVLMLALHMAVLVYGQPLRWPIAGGSMGNQVFLRPGDTLNGQSNGYYLCAKDIRGSNVICPLDAKVVDVEYSYRRDLRSSEEWRLEQEATLLGLHVAIEKIAELRGIDPRSICASVVLEQGSLRVTISGIAPTRLLSVGQHLRAGDVLGRVGYFMTDCSVPNISILTAEKGMFTSPVRYFRDEPNHGVRDVPRKQAFSATEMRCELHILYRLLLSGFPASFDYTSRESLDSVFRVLYVPLDGTWHRNRYQIACSQLVRAVRDPNVHLETFVEDDRLRLLYRYPVLFGVLRDSLVITWNALGYGQLIGKRIEEVDGLPADTVVRFIKESTRGKLSVYGGAGYIDEMYRLIDLLSGSVVYYLWYRPWRSPHGVRLKLAGGTQVSYDPLPEEMGYLTDTPPTVSYRLEETTYPVLAVDMLSRDVGYMAFHSFNFKAGTLDSVCDYIDGLNKKSVEHLIVDLRGTSSGDMQWVNRFYQMLAEGPFKDHLYRSVVQRGQLDVFRFSSEGRDSSDYFLDFTDSTVVGEYRKANSIVYSPDTVHHFGGTLYVLTNEQTSGVGSRLAAMVRRDGRGLIVGRETNTPYYSTTVGPNLEVELPWSHFTFTMPLVREVFDTVQVAGLPWGRGVIPDYMVDYSLEELMGERPDTILNYALDLISHRSTISAETAARSRVCRKGAIAILLIIAVVLGGVLVAHRRRFGSSEVV